MKTMASGRRLLERGAGTLTVALVAANVGNFVFHAVVARRVGAADYGALSSLLATLLALSLPMAAVQIVITQAVGAARAVGRPWGAATLAVRATVAGVTLFVVTTMAAPAAARFLDLSSPVPVVWLGVVLVPMITGMVGRALLLGELRFGAVAAAAVVGTALRVVLGWLLVDADGVPAAMAVTALAEAVAASMLLWSARSSLRRFDRPLTVAWQDARRSLTALAGLWGLLAVDVILARHYLGGEEAGTYSAAAVLGRTALFLPQGLVTVAHARLSAAGSRDAMHVLRLSLGAVVAVGVVSTLGLTAVSDRATALLFGDAIDVPASLVFALASASTLLAVAGLLAHHHLALGVRGAAAGWVGIGVAVAVAVLHHPNGSGIAMAAVAGATATVAALWALPRLAMTGRRPHLGTVMTGPLWDGARPAVDITVVVPFYNPGVVVRAHVSDLVRALKRTGVSFEVLAVDDGSTDGSAASLRTLDRSVVKVLRLHSNCGKGAALRTGLSAGRGRYVGFIDGDGDLSPTHWHAFMELMKLYEPDAVLGSKRHPLSEVHYPPIRRVYSWGYQRLVAVLFRLRVRDSQTGIKLFRRDVLQEVLPHTSQDGFVFDLELLAVARRLGHGRFLEAPVRVEHRFTSTISFRNVIRILVETVALRMRLGTRAPAHVASTTPPPLTPAVTAAPAPHGMAL